MSRHRLLREPRKTILLAISSIAVALVLAACSVPPPGGGGGTACNDYREGTFTMVFGGVTYTDAAAESYGGANGIQPNEVVGLTLNSDQGDPDNFLRFNYAVDSSGDRVLAVNEMIDGTETIYGYVEGSGGGSITSDTFTANFGGSGLCPGNLIGDGTATGALSGTVSELLNPANVKTLDISGVEVVLFDVTP